MITLAFFLEELFARALLEGLLPRILPMERVLDGENRSTSFGTFVKGVHRLVTSALEEER